MPQDTSEALIIVDLQRDFMPGGPLAVARADELVGPIAKSMPFFSDDRCVATRDLHPPRHCSFASTYRDRKKFSTLRLDDISSWTETENGLSGPSAFSVGELCEYLRYDADGGQVLWPDHCVEGTPGSRVHPDVERLATVVWNKGMNPGRDSYSAFNDNGGVSTGLADYLRQRGVKRVVICGIAYDVCVLYTALDAVRLGFETIVVTDLCAAVSPEGKASATKRMGEAGVRLVRSDEILHA